VVLPPFVAAILLCFLVSACGRPSGERPPPHSTPSPTPLRAVAGEGPFAAPTFSPAPGWTTISTDPVALDPESFPETIATTVPLADAEQAYVTAEGTLRVSLFPDATLRAMPSSGIVIVAGLPLPDMTPAPPNNPNFPDRSLPLHLADALVYARWEGRPDPDIPQYLLLARLGEIYVDVRVFFGSQTPSAEMLSAAQEELNRLSFGQ
jgi:hypothetical protein